MIKLIMHLGGLDNSNGPFYLFWSGIGSGFSIITLIVVLANRIKNKIEIHHHHHYYNNESQAELTYKQPEVDY